MEESSFYFIGSVVLSIQSIFPLFPGSESLLWRSPCGCSSLHPVAAAWLCYPGSPMNLRAQVVFALADAPARLPSRQLSSRP